MPFLSLRALWKGLKGNSLVFSIVFAMALLGFSLAGILRSPLKAIGLWWPLIFILPVIAIGWSAKFEKGLKLEPSFKRLLCLILILGSVVLSILLWWTKGFLNDRYADSVQPGPKFEPPREETLPRGPRHRP
ncbi:hypothetical protein G0Q06_07530 [Puniceicoccales bacterium CK1056]|uniref:Uncharacterized protein n=1 Tax=Oceanipulchritudo coccoides TaxID=2706888 RepID=A0A6B2M2D7_9BACT|nr:hypothetical protein [Oceanipulchritudo coccoides]NDV62294.1 hypothetical protein [Oceanipulchritudo coccoides]